MTSSVMINRLDTGVPGLDEVLGGGLPEYSFVLIAGEPGCGKTTLAHQIMFAQASAERPALYFTVLGESALKMMRYQQQFDFYREEAIGKSVHFLNLSDEAQAGNLDQVLRRIEVEVERHGPSLVFVDSFRSVVLSSDDGRHSHNNLHQFVQQLGMLMTSWQATTFLVGEYYSDMDSNPVFTVADGVIWLRQSIERNSMVRKLQIKKMRGQPLLPGLHPYRIGREGIEVFAPAPLRTPVDPSRSGHYSGRAMTGIPRLDEMLGGGIPRGHSLLVAGPSGSGKSILAAAFLAEGVRAGEKGVMVTFEQRPNRLVNPELVELIESGQVALVDSGAPDLSLEEVVRRLLDECERLQASRVVMDSLSGFELALAPTFHAHFRESLLRMIRVLSSEGITVVMTSELEDRYTDLRFSPYGTAFLTDAIIVQRYIEVDSRLRRVIAVVKVRSSHHSDELREYTITDKGIEIGCVLGDQEGLLGGRPTRKRKRSEDIAEAE
ncbi:MAG: AAA family ATPase [Pseudomonadota bacterium]|nr:AAA family ATPase [Pseudomonadota bacterium]